MNFFKTQMRMRNIFQMLSLFQMNFSKFKCVKFCLSDDDAASAAFITLSQPSSGSVIHVITQRPLLFDVGHEINQNSFVN